MKQKLNRAARRALAYGTKPIVANSDGCTITMPDGPTMKGTLFCRYDMKDEFKALAHVATLTLTECAVCTPEQMNAAVFGADPLRMSLHIGSKS